VTQLELSSGDGFFWGKNPAWQIEIVAIPIPAMNY
jgi:hypothetical protein